MDDDNDWRLTALPARFWILDSRGAFVVPPVFLHIRLWTIGMALVVLVVLWFIERRGYSPEVVLRMLRLWLAGAMRVPIRIKTFDEHFEWQMVRMSERF